MGKVVDIPVLAEFERRRAQRQTLRLRIDRRARELAQRDQERYFRAIVADLMHGRLAEQLVEYWEPIIGGVGPAPQTQR